MDLIELDGSAGGQVIRTAIGLSAYTGKPVKITKIRAARPNPGIQAQHLEAINAVRELCGAETEDAELGSKELEFYPKEIREKNIKIRIPTAGSIALVIQALMVPLLKIQKDVKIEFNGGATYGKWAPPVDCLSNVLFPLLGRFGHRASVNIHKHGFYPEGGAEVSVTFLPSKLSKIEITKRGEIKSIKGVSVASIDLENPRVAERQKSEALKIISVSTGINASIDCHYENSRCAGSGIQLWAETQNSILGASAIGERGKKSEDIGKEAASLLVEQLSGAVDEFMGDQLLPFMAIFGGEICTPRITDHVKANISTIEKFLPVRFATQGKRIVVTKS